MPFDFTQDRHSSSVSKDLSYVEHRGIDDIDTWLVDTLSVDEDRRLAKPIGRNSFPHLPSQEIAALRLRLS